MSERPVRSRRPSKAAAKKASAAKSSPAPRTAAKPAAADRAANAKTREVSVGTDAAFASGKYSKSAVAVGKSMAMHFGLSMRR